MPGRMMEVAMEENSGLGDKRAKVEELLEMLLQGMGGELKSKYMPAPEPPAEEAEDILEAGAAQAGDSPALAKEQEEPEEDELAMLLAALGG